MEDVWQYPRPPALQRCHKPIRIDFAGRTIAETNDAWRVLETSHPPVYYLPRDAFRDCVIEAAPGRSLCEWKGQARYWSIRVGEARAVKVAWSYPDPEPAFADIADHLAVYAGPMDGCFVDGERVTPQPGGFYGGWITADLKGPFKGGPGSMGW